MGRVSGSGAGATYTRSLATRRPRETTNRGSAKLGSPRADSALAASSPPETSIVPYTANLGANSLSSRPISGNFSALKICGEARAAYKKSAPNHRSPVPTTLNCKAIEDPANATDHL